MSHRAFRASTYTLGATSILCLFLFVTACGPKYHGPPPQEPFGQDWITIPDSTDQMLLQMELWRTRLGVSECLVDTTKNGIEARVGLVTLDLYVSPDGIIDSARTQSPRATPQMMDCLRDVVRTWVVGTTDNRRQYRFTLPMSARLADADLGGPLNADREDRQTMRSVMGLLWRSGPSLAECYLMARPVLLPSGGSHGAGGGLVVVRFDVTPDGRVQDVRIVESTIRGFGMDSCLVNTILDWRLPRGKGGAFEFPINFSPEYTVGSAAKDAEQESDGVSMTHGYFEAP
jgi:TonB family protein